MSSVDTETVAEGTVALPMVDSPDTAPKKSGTVFKVPVVKAKTTMEIDTADLPDAVYHEALLLGLKTILNRGTTKITKAAYPKEEELKAAALEKAKTIFEDMKAGKIKLSGGKAEKTSGAVMTEARRIAKALVKEEIKAQKLKLRDIDAADITKAANALIAANPQIIEQAKAEVEAREAKAKALKASISQIVTPGMVNKEKAAKAEAEKAAAKAGMEKVLSAAKAGQVQARNPKGGGKAPAPKA